MRITSKGQVTIPVEIRKRAGLLPNTEVDFVYERGKVFLRKHDGGPTRGDRIVAHLRGRGSVAMKTEEIMALTRAET